MWQHVGLLLFVQDDTLIHLSTSHQTSTDLRVEEEMMERHQFWVYNTVLQNRTRGTRGTRGTRRFLRAVCIHNQPGLVRPLRVTDAF